MARNAIAERDHLWGWELMSTLVEGTMRAIKIDAVTAIVVGLFCVSTVPAALGQQQPAPQPQPQQVAYPAGKAVEMTVMFGAGSAADVTARYLADGMAKRLNVPVPVVNRTGGGGAIGYSYVQKQKPDGYSVVWNSNSVSTTYHSGMLPFDYRAFDAVARVLVESPRVLEAELRDRDQVVELVLRAGLRGGRRRHRCTS